MDRIIDLVKVNGRVPRRAVLLGDGSVGDKTVHPTVPETELLSRVCEICRAHAKQPVLSRKTAELLESALASNCSKAWEALRDDMLTSDMDYDAAVAVLNQSPNPSVVITCLVGARDNNHMMHIACVLARTLDRLSEEARAELGRAMACQLTAVMDSLASRGGLMQRDVRDAVLTGFGKIIASMGSVPDARVAECVLRALTTRKDELVRLFLEVTPSFIHHRPQIMPMLMDRAVTATASNRLPVMTMLARIVAWAPEVVYGHEAAIAKVVASALTAQDQLDSRDCHAAAELAVACGCDDTVKALGRALLACSAALIERATAA